MNTKCWKLCLVAAIELIDDPDIKNKDLTNWCYPCNVKISYAECLALWLLAECKCTYCGAEAFASLDAYCNGFQLDHILPKSAGSEKHPDRRRYPELENKLWNLTLACKACNGPKDVWDPCQKPVPSDWDFNTRQVLPPHQYRPEYRSFYIGTAKAHIRPLRGVFEPSTYTPPPSKPWVTRALREAHFLKEKELLQKVMEQIKNEGKCY